MKLASLQIFLTDEELATVAPMLERLTTLDDRAEKQKDFHGFCKSCVASVY